MRLRLTLVALLLWGALAPAPLQAEDGAGQPQRQAQTAAPAAAPQHQGVLRLLPPDAVSDKRIVVSGRSIDYVATAGTLPLYDQSGDETAVIYYTAYVAKGTDAAKRPITFAFNGGPGAAAAFLNLGLVGPRIVDFGPAGDDGAKARLIDNPHSWLEFTDLVLIDPVGAGWSRTAKPDAASSFWGVSRDAESLAKFIALYVARNSRSASPKYLLGESYGGFRAVKVARALQQDQGIVVSGIVMVSPMLEAAFQWDGGRFALTAALHFPSLVAAELERTGRYTAEAMAEAERFAITEYLTTLAGPRPKGDAAKAFYARIARMTGLPEEVVANARGYVRGAYMRQLRARGRIASPYDAAFSVPDPYPASESDRSPDPILDGFTRALSGVFVGYARDELGFKTDITYLLLNSEVARRWDWGGRRSQPGVLDDLRALMSLDPSFRLLVAHGRSDLVTPYGVSRYLIDELPDVGEPRRAELKTYRGGHMFYFAPDSRSAFTVDVKRFFLGPS